MLLFFMLPAQPTHDKKSQVGKKRLFGRRLLLSLMFAKTGAVQEGVSQLIQTVS
jgi:hypothetical protein